MAAAHGPTVRDVLVTLRLLVLATIGAAVGFGAAYWLVWTFVEMDMVLPFYLLGVLIGAAVGVAAALALGRSAPKTK